ncbi:MAG: cell wall hydrolase [Alphaproteobacteria bacterium]|nr:cell wall hydrolase [Alphaproteobacteria bacterium]
MNFSEQDFDTLVRTIYGEARSEFFKFGFAPLIAVANVIINRKKKNFENSIHEVCIKPYQFTCWNKNDPNYKIIKNANSNCMIFRKCREVAENLLSDRWPDLTDGCDHYHARNIKPYWAVYKEPKRIFGNHFFYALK